MDGGKECGDENREYERESELWCDEDMTHKDTQIFPGLVNWLRNILFNIKVQ